MPVYRRPLVGGQPTFDRDGILPAQSPHLIRMVRHQQGRDAFDHRRTMVKARAFIARRSVPLPGTSSGAVPPASSTAMSPSAKPGP